MGRGWLLPYSLLKKQHAPLLPSKLALCSQWFLCWFYSSFILRKVYQSVAFIATMFTYFLRQTFDRSSQAILSLDTDPSESWAIRVDLMIFVLGYTSLVESQYICLWHNENGEGGWLGLKSTRPTKAPLHCNSIEHTSHSSFSQCA